VEGAHVAMRGWQARSGQLRTQQLRHFLRKVVLSPMGADAGAVVCVHQRNAYIMDFAPISYGIPTFALGRDPNWQPGNRPAGAEPGVSGGLKSSRNLHCTTSNDANQFGLHC
jgi:hypothetical protein